MCRRLGGSLSLCLVLIASMVAVVRSVTASETGITETSITEARKSEIINMVLQDCGSCHGMTLKGGLGPALSADAIADKSVDMLVDTIIQGRTGTAMPPWKAFLNKSEAWWIVENLKRGTIK